MKIYQLPDDLMTGFAVSQNEVIIRHYQSGHNAIRNKIILNRNMINLIFSGSKTIVYPETTVTVNQGQLVILSAGNILTSEVIASGQEFTSVLLYFSNEVLNRFWAKYEFLLEKPPLQNNKRPFLTYLQDHFILHYAESLLLLLKNPVALSAEIKSVKLEELLLYLLQVDPIKLQSLQIVLKNQEDLNLKKAVASQVGQPISVAELAFLCNMSSSTFKRKFERLYGTSPQKWLQNQRMQLAAELLKSPSELPSQVYHKIGYQSHSSFSGAFRQHFGCTPSEYHAQQLNVLR